MKPPTVRPLSWRGDLLALMPVALIVVAFYGWTVTSNAPEQWVAPHQGDYYNLLADGFAHGHLYLRTPVDPALYLPAAQRPAGYVYLLDASLYHGHYYLYFGVTPAVTIFLPFRLLTGLEVNQLVVVGLQGTVAFLLGLAILLLLRRHFAPAASRLILAVAALAWGFGSALPVAMRKPHMYEVAITAGMAWSTAFLLFALLALLRPRRVARWLGLASLCAGLAVGSRPNLICGATLLGGVLLVRLWQARRQGDLSRRRATRWIVATLGPAAAGGILLVVYNFLRFGNGLEFGHRYQVASDANGFLSPGYFWHNLQLYYLTWPATGWFFPFFGLGWEGPRPAGYVGTEPLHGQLFVLLWCAALGLCVAWARRKDGDAAVARRRVFLLLGWWFAANFILIALTSVRANRYLLDFHPALVLVGGFLLLQAATIPRTWLRRTALAAGLVGVAAIVVFEAAISFETMGFMQRVNPVGYARLEREANRLVWPLFRLTRPRFGPRAFAVAFPAAAPGTLEPLLSAGPPQTGVTLYVHYLEPGRAQLILNDGLVSSDPTAGPKGPIFDTRPGQARKLVVELGSFFPPAGDPWFGRATLADMQRLVTSARVILDDREILHVSAPPRAASPGDVHLGWRKVDGNPRRQRFSGVLREAGEAPSLPDRPPDPGAGWGYHLDLQFPQDRFGAVEPLLTTGTWPVGDSLLVRYRDRRSIEILHDQHGGGIVSSVVIPLDYDRPQAFTVWFDPVGEDVLDGPLRLSLFHEGQLVLIEQAPLLPFAYGQEAIGASLLHSSMAGEVFSGDVLSVTRADLPGVAQRVIPEHEERVAALRFALPATAEAQPLLGFTQAGGGRAFLAMRHRGGEAQLGWSGGEGWRWTQPLPESGDAVHTVGVQWSLAGHAASGADARPFSAMILVDGIICRPPEPNFFSAPITGLSAWGGAAGTAARFTGRIEPPPSIRTLLATRAIPSPLRRVQLVVRFPGNRPGRNEPLLTTGKPGAADSLYVHYESAGWLRLGFDHWGTGGARSSRVHVNTDGYQILDVEFGPGRWADPSHGAGRVRLNGQLILEATMDFFPAAIGEVTVGHNAVGLSTSDADFTGSIFPVEDFGVGP